MAKIKAKKQEELIKEVVGIVEAEKLWKDKWVLTDITYVGNNDEESAEKKYRFKKKVK